jgi:hypothetical protein
MVFGGAADWAKVESVAKHRIRKQTAARMIDTPGIEGIEEAESYLPLERDQSVEIPTRMATAPGSPLARRPS